ncbi:hypothetical protein D0T57_05535 [Dysgonomonas sp. 511]|nr:hypothetical protein [Dysgonomonas sp. 511]
MTYFFLMALILTGCKNKLQGKEKPEDDYYRIILPANATTISGEVDSIYCSLYSIDKNDRMNIDWTCSYHFAPDRNIVYTAKEYDSEGDWESTASYVSENGKYITSIMSHSKDFGKATEYYFEIEKNKLMGVLKYEDNPDMGTDTTYTEYTRNIMIITNKRHNLEKRLTFDNKGNILTSVSADDKSYTTSKSRYDANNLIVEETFKGTGLGISHEIYTYKTDEKGNWIECMMKDDSNHRTRITKRKIFYR